MKRSLRAAVLGIVVGLTLIATALVSNHTDVSPSVMRPNLTGCDGCPL